MNDRLSQTRLVRLGPSGRAALQLLACCPRIPTDVVAVLLGMRHTSSAIQLLTRLQNAGLVRTETARPGPLLGIRSVRLWSLTASGRTITLRQGSGPMAKDQDRLPYGGPLRLRDPHRQPDVPLLIVAYRLLGVVASSQKQRMRVVAWEHLWVRSFRPVGHTRLRHARLPAAAVLAPDGDSATSAECVQVLLLPDVGSAPVARYCPVLRTLLELRRHWVANDQDEPLLAVATVAPGGAAARVEAWKSLVQQASQSGGEPPLRVRVVTAAEASVPYHACDSTKRWVAQGDQLLSLVARHPLLTREQLAVLIGVIEPRIVRLEAELLEQGWIQPIVAAQLPRDIRVRIVDRIQRLGLVELTPAGRREAARRLLVSGPVATRHHGLVGGRLTIQRFLRQAAHTVGANAFFVALIHAARNRSRRGDDALEEWRSAAACARGRFRPDGYGCYRRGESRFGFFLEYDRGTERPNHYAAKIATYYRYRDSGTGSDDYLGFPTLLFVTNSDDAEARFAYQVYLAQQQHGRAPLPVLLTTSRHIAAHHEGVIGPVWRAPATIGSSTHVVRGYWLPGRGGPVLVACWPMRGAGLAPVRCFAEPAH
jgi:hypothetical protein